MRDQQAFMIALVGFGVLVLGLYLVIGMARRGPGPGDDE